MGAIIDGIGPSFAPAYVARQSAPLPSPTANGRTGRGQPAQAAGAGETERFGDLGRLYEARGHGWAEAVRVRQLDGKLGKLADRAGDVKVELEQVKLYPPFPIDEPRRAAAIREFNGLAEEIKKMETNGEAPGVKLTTLAPNASTAAAESAANALLQVQHRLESRRAALAERVASGSGGDAEASSRNVGTALGGGGGTGITGVATDLLRQIA